MSILTNLVWYLGEDKLILDTVYEADGTTPQNMVGWNLSFVLHAYGDPTAVFFTLTNGSGIDMTQAAVGILAITEARALTVNLYPNTYQWYLERTDSGVDAIVSNGLVSLLQK